MGFYIEVSTNKGKADILIKEHGARELSTPEYVNTPEEITVCVADNGPFEAAGICYDQAEFDAFNQPSDPRNRRWLVVAKSVAKKLCNHPHVEKALE